MQGQPTTQQKMGLDSRSLSIHQGIPNCINFTTSFAQQQQPAPRHSPNAIAQDIQEIQQLLQTIQQEQNACQILKQEIEGCRERYLDFKQQIGEYILIMEHKISEKGDIVDGKRQKTMARAEEYLQHTL